jgi:hypothetical protein
MSNLYQRFFVTLVATLLTCSVSAENKLADPTMPANYKQKTFSTPLTNNTDSTQYEWVLNTTIVSPYQKIAVINGRQFKVGEEVQGAKIIQIAHQRVLLDFKGKKIELLLQRSFISQVNAAKRK